jgi:hypothetical protein
MLPFSRSAISSPRSIFLETILAQASAPIRFPDSKDNPINQSVPAALKYQALEHDPKKLQTFWKRSCGKTRE